MNKRITMETDYEIYRMYSAGMSYYDIGQKLGFTRQTIKLHVQEGIKLGFIDERKEEPKRKVQPKGTVNCTSAVSRKCMYGCKSPNSLCDYYFITGELRSKISPDPTCCKCYKEGKKGKIKF